jgi:GNAT superfamily N-acetyltransferase
MRGLSFSTADQADAEEIAALRNSVNADLTRRFSLKINNVTASGVLLDLRNGQLLVARYKVRIVGSLLLVKKKPWAIDVSYFTPATQPLYVRSMITAPELQRKGIGSRLIKAAIAAAKLSGADAVRLDAFDADHGAEGFYVKCGFAERGRTTYRNAPLVYFEWLL